MNIKKDNTEEKILDAATTVFVLKGMEGARMQEIADEAGINKALLHYYFRSKERLFEAIFSNVINLAFPQLTQILKSEVPFVTKMEQIIDAYIVLLRKHPFLPAFVLKELNRDPSGLFKLVIKYGLNPLVIINQLEEAMARGEIVRMDPRHLAMNIISMCVFPFAARPILNFMLFKDDAEALDQFYAERADVIKKFLKDAIVINEAKE